MSLYHGKCILAPMVRIGNVGFRMVCASRGADVVFSDEIVSNKLELCRREVVCYDESAGFMVEYVIYQPFKNHYKRVVVFTTPQRSKNSCGGEGGAPVVLQLGVQTPEIGAAAALLCCDDVDAIDVNMGCPKKFSVCSGMGATLMQDTARAASILVAIDNALNAPARLAAMGGRRVPLSFKIRLLDTAEKTAQMLISIMEGVGPNRVHAITLHARTVDQSSKSPPHYEHAAETVKKLRSHPLFKEMCFVLNGSVTSRADGVAKMKQYGFDAVMIARHAIWDMTVFSPHKVPQHEECGAVSGKSPDRPLAATSWIDLYRDLLRSYWKYRIPFPLLKYHFSRSISFICAIRHLLVAVQHTAKNYEDVATIFGLPADEREAMRCAVDDVLVECPPEETGVFGVACRRRAIESNSGSADESCSEGELEGREKNSTGLILKKLRKC